MNDQLSGMGFAFLSDAEKNIPAYIQHYDPGMVIASVLIAMFASFCAFEMSSRRSKFLLALGALMLGMGTWSMHFVGMMALRLDCGVSYNPWITLLSSLPAIAAAAWALRVLQQDTISTSSLALSGLIIGAGIGIMHYSGMAAMRLQGVVRYDLLLFLQSLAAAVLAAMAALAINRWLLIKERKNPYLASIAGGGVMGIAISSMHYIAMRAAYFIPVEGTPAYPDNQTTTLFIYVLAGTLTLLITGFAFLYIHIKFSSLIHRMSSIQQMMEQGFVMTDEVDRILEVNPAFIHMLGLTNKTDLIGRSIVEWLPEGLKTEKTKFYSQKLARPDGHLISCEVNGYKFWDADTRQTLKFAIFTDVTDRIRAEEMIQRQIKQFTDLLKSVPDPMLVVDSEGTIIMTNRIAEDFFGYEHAALIQHKIDMLVPLGLRKEFRRWTEHYLKAPEALQFGTKRALYARTALGLQVPVELSIRPHYIDDSLWVVCIAHDISQRLKAQEQLRAMIAEQNAIFNATSSGIVLVHAHSISRINQRACEIVGCKVDSMIGKPLQSWFKNSDDFQNFSKTAYQEALGSGAYQNEFEFVKDDKQSIWVALSVSAVDQADPAQGFVVMITDKTKERETLEQINIANNERAAILDAAVTGMSFTLNRTIMRTNRRMHEIFGWPLWEMIGQPTSIVYPDQQSSDKVFKLYEQLWTGSSPSLDIQLKRKDGSLFWCRLSGRAIDINDREKGTVWSFEDITHDVEQSEALKLAKEEAEAATRAKSEFLSNMSHEIRTPMNAIIGMSNLALKTKLDGKQRDYIERVNRAGTSLLGIINDILDFSKIEAGKLSMESIDFNLEDVISHVADMLNHKTEEKGLEFIFDASANVPLGLIGDPLRLGQVLTNLANNAVKFTHKGEIVLGVEMMSRADAEVTLHFWVSDTGIGISPEDQGRLFNSFSQADSSTSRKFGGTGLGLAISKQIVTLMNGRIWVESELGVGTTFHFLANFGVQKNAQSARTMVAEELAGLRMLVVDDNMTALKVFSAMAQSFGLKVDIADNGEEALAKIGQAQMDGEPYKLILADWHMPEMDGVSMLKKLEQMHPDSPSSVMMVTAYSKETLEATIQDVGVKVSTVLTKPLSPSTLFEAIGIALSQRLDIRKRSLNRVSASKEDLNALKGARVLLVEDNDMNQVLALELFQDAGIDVTVAENGQVALDILQTDQDFDGILMDCQMPVMDGYTATRLIKSNEQLTHIPIVAMTANAMAGDRQKVIAAGMSDYIVKPLDVDVMFRTMAKWIKPGKRATLKPDEHFSENSDATSLAIKLPLSLPGIEIQEGLARVMNKEVLYLSLLLRFRESQANFVQQFQTALKAQDLITAERLAHTLKSTSGSIGAGRLQEIAAHLEISCTRGDSAPVLDTLLTQVAAELSQVLEGLTALEAGVQQNQTVATLDPAQMMAVENQLLAALANGDSEAVKTWRESRDMFYSAYPHQAKQIDREIQGFDFEAALETLQDAIKTAKSH